METESNNNNSNPISDHLKSIILGLCIGDALGATSEFQIPWYITIMIKFSTTKH